MDPVTFYGFTPVVRDPEVLFQNHPTASGDHPKQDPFKAEDFPLPNSQLAREVAKFAKEELDEQTFNHSNRVFIYGVALTKTHFPSWSFDLETYFLACMLHDIGTAKKFLSTTKMSFEFKGGIIGRDLILSLGGVEDQADSVCDAIIRHQDIFVKGGNITMIGQVLQLATILDNVGIRANLVHPSLIETTCAAYPRKGWSQHFASVIEQELKLKPWCHTTTFEVPNWKEGIRSNFATDVRNNTFMHKFD
ncbi:hypothetical protein AMATHDRAFT_64532 [Amanita thiersii Skay4041]|uniref:HD domain-containing protein n=1 Tax=Amanita thiersii Skay4041 TaxID=703135 RepID=A0A2A9NKL4_9AGAR|nr:hypothetical protein AMATHDRAFT_64532 [Amanita thiersii Skay4041]